jgi:hypothetical protein
MPAGGELVLQEHTKAAKPRQRITKRGRLLTSRDRESSSRSIRQCARAVVGFTGFTGFTGHRGYLTPWRPPGRLSLLTTSDHRAHQAADLGGRFSCACLSRIHSLIRYVNGTVSQAGLDSMASPGRSCYFRVLRHTTRDSWRPSQQSPDMGTTRTSVPFSMSPIRSPGNSV